MTNCANPESQPRPGRIITLTTDFGLRDSYVAAMKGVILSICHDANLVDLTHEIPSHDVFEGAVFLRDCAHLYPPGTVHLAVVDPGVGGTRGGICIKSRHYTFVGPDNGLLSLAANDDGVIEARSIENEDFLRNPASDTFHGRDIFAPVAAHALLGVPIERFGPEVTRFETLTPSEPECVSASMVQGEIVRIDRFGNLVTNIAREHLGQLGRSTVDADLSVEIEGRSINGIHTCYEDEPPGTLLALWGSSGALEVSINQGDAATTLGAQRHTVVRVSAGRQV